MTGELQKAQPLTLGEVANVTEDLEVETDNTTESVEIETTQGNSVANSTSNDVRTPWDPRIYAVDALYCVNKDEMAMVVPFSTQSVATAFSDLVYVGPSKIVSEISSRLSGASSGSSSGSTASVDTAFSSRNFEDASGTSGHVYSYVHNSNDPDYAKDPDVMGMQSLMNPYSITRLAGAIRTSPNGDGLVFSAGSNMLFDIRDSRRFYDFHKENDSSLEDSTADRLAVLDPTTTNIIKYSNKDPWGRTPYNFQDFVFSKWWGIIPNNRLITLRKYSVPCIDNLNFDGMMEESANASQKDYSSFAPVSTVLTYFGGESGNRLSDLLKFSTGMNWGKTEANVWEVNGEAGTNQDQLMDEMITSGDIFSSNDEVGRSSKFVDTFMKGAGGLSKGIFQIGKLGSFLNGEYSEYAENDYVQKATNAMQDPYDNGPYANKIKGPVNVIKEVRKREQGLKFEQSFTIKCSYIARPIGGINTKAAMLDILSNCLMMGSANAMFWGGGHRFKVKPNSYPWKLNDKTKGFMKRLHDGKVFGEDGAIAYMHEGIKSFGSDQDGNWSWDVTMNKMKGFLGTALGALQSVLNSVNSFFGNVFKNGINVTSSENEEAGSSIVEGAKKVFEGRMHNRVLSKTTFPTITGFRSLLTGEPVGEWHLMVGNPLNPIIVCGNLICTDMSVTFSDELGPDDFPVQMDVTYTLEHGMPRDSAAIQSMFNRGEGKIYNLPDYIAATTSDFESRIDAFTGVNFPMPAQGLIGGTEAMKMQSTVGTNISTSYGSYTISKPTELSVIGNTNTTLVTKFTPYYSNALVSSLTGTRENPLIGQLGLMPVYKGNLMDRKSLR